MNSRRDTYPLSIFNCFMVTLESCDHKHVTVVASDALTKCSSSHSVLSFGVSFESVQISLQIGVSVDVTVC